MDTIFLIYIFVLGALVGSFINVVSMRFNTGLSSLKGRSICFHCGKTLKWYELLPVVSFLFLRGKCRSCKTKLSFQYLLVELVMGFIFVGIAIRQYSLWHIYGTYPHGMLYSVLFFLYYAVIFSLLAIIFLYDMRHSIIPDRFVYTFIILAVAKLLLFVYFKGFPLGTVDFLDISAMFILFIPFALLWLVSAGKWIGFGDAKLALGIGALLGFTLGLSTIILAFWIGATWSVFLIVRDSLVSKHSRLNMKSEIPFAPFLVIAVVIVFFSHIDIFGINNFLGLMQ